MASETQLEQAPDMSVREDGLYLVGEFLGFRERAEREVNGRKLKNADIGIRMDGGTIEAVQYGGLEYAHQAVPAGTIVGDRIALAVENRHGVKDGRSWQFYTGTRSGGSSAFANEFGA